MAKEYIKRVDLENRLHALCAAQRITAQDAIDIAILPAADVAPVVRCKDCASFNAELAVSPWSGVCRFFNNHSVMADDFCSYGERLEVQDV